VNFSPSPPVPPEYNPYLSVPSKFPWDNFVSPFGQPIWPEATKDRYVLLVPAGGRQRPVSDQYASIYREFYDHWSTIAKTRVWGRVFSSHATLQMLEDDLKLGAHRDFDSHRIPDTVHKFNRYLRHEIACPPLYGYLSERPRKKPNKPNRPIPFFWLPDIMAFVLQFYEADVVTHYDPYFLHFPISQEIHTWGAWFTWFLAGQPSPDHSAMLSWKIFVDEYRTGNRKSSENTDLSFTLAGFLTELADDAQRKILFCSVPNGEDLREIFNAIIVPPLKMLEEKAFKWRGRTVYGSGYLAGMTFLSPT
jgi:hypothetical protein